jgi:hypothetical protein
MQTLREAGSYLQFEHKVLDMHLSGGNVGSLNHSKAFIAELVPCIFKCTIERIKAYLHKTDPVTKRHQVFSLNADKVTELHRTGQAIGVITFEEGELKALFVDYRHVLGHTGEEITEDIFEGALMQHLGFTREELRQQLSSFAADGQYFCLGCPEHLARLMLNVSGNLSAEDTSAVVRMVEWLLCTWDPAHRMELSLKSVREDKEGVDEELNSVSWYPPIPRDISQVYSNISYGKGYEMILQIAEDMGRRLYSMERFCDTRFAQSEQKVYANFLRDYPELCAAIEQLAQDEQQHGRRSRKARDAAATSDKLTFSEMLENMRKFDWVGRIVALQGLLRLCMDLSLKMQAVNVIPWELVEAQSAFKATIDSIARGLDPDTYSAEFMGNPIPKEVFPFMHERADAQGQFLGTWHEMLLSGEFMGQTLTVDERDAKGRDAGDARKQALLSLGYDIADWCRAASHWFQQRFTNDIHGKVLLCAQAFDLRMFVSRTFPSEYSSFGAFLDADVKTPLSEVHAWMKAAGIDLPDFEIVYGECVALATVMHQDVLQFYQQRSSDTAFHPWHKGGELGEAASSGTVIQRDVLTKERFFRDSPSYLFMYHHAVLKISNEAVVEGMCSVVHRHASTARGLSFKAYAEESIIVWNAPVAHKAEPLMTEALDLYFKDRYKTWHHKGWRFWHVDTNKSRVSKCVISQMIDRMKSATSKFLFMDSKSG